MNRSASDSAGVSIRRRRLLVALGVSGLAGYARLPPDGRTAQVGGNDWRPEAKLTASDAASGAFFGSSVALDGTRALVGAQWDSAAAPGAGAAYLFELDAATGRWTEVAKLSPSDPHRGAQFGASVALDGSHALVGAPDSSAATEYAGAAYVFSRHDDGTWPVTEDRTFAASDTAPGDAFGHAVALDGTRAVVGAPGTETGTVYVFERRADGNWPATPDAVVVGDDGETGFGRTLAIDRGIALVGGSDVTLFSRWADGDWRSEGTLAPAGTGERADGFGHAVALDGTTSLVGAPFDADGGEDVGAAYAFSRSGVRKFVPAEGVSGGAFGLTVSIDGPRALVGAPGDIRRATARGEAYLFDLTTDRLTARHRLAVDGVTPEDGYGWAVALDGERALVSAGADDEGGPFAGAVHVFAAPTAETPTATPPPATRTTGSPTPTRRRPTALPAADPPTEVTPTRATAAGLVGLVTGFVVGLAGDEGFANVLTVLAFLFGGGGVVQLLLTERSDAVAFLAIAVAVGVLAGVLLGYALRRSGE